MQNHEIPAVLVAIAADTQIDAEWPRVGAIPNDFLRDQLRRAGHPWPRHDVTIEIEHPESVDSRGWHRPARTETVAAVIVPLSLARELARRSGRPITVLIKGRYSE
jgi:hypothetical protein